MPHSEMSLLSKIVRLLPLSATTVPVGIVLAGQTPVLTLPPTPPAPSGSPEERLLQDFQSDLGVALTKVAHNSWKDGPGTGGFIGEDSVTFYTNYTNSLCTGAQQAVSITNSAKEMWPFHGECMGYSNWGFIFSLREEDEFWKYFETHEACHGYGHGAVGAPLMSQCGDCSALCCGQHCGSGLVGNQLSYEEWAQNKNMIVHQTGNMSVCPQVTPCPGEKDWPSNHAWNEFSTNGLSYNALVGILRDYTGPSGQMPPNEYPPRQQHVCNFLSILNEQKQPPKTGNKWPMFDLKVSDGSSSLDLSGYLDCDAGTELKADGIQETQEFQV